MDFVSGATASSKVILKAIEDAFNLLKEKSFNMVKPSLKNWRWLALGRSNRHFCESGKGE